METAISTMSALPTTKKEIKNYVELFVNEFKNCNRNPLQVYEQIKAMDMLIKELTSNEDIKNRVLNEAQKYGVKSFEAYNSKIEIAELGVTYDYDCCGDLVLNSLMAEKKLLHLKIKERQEFLKSIPYDGITTVNDETGEVSVLMRPIKKSTTGIKLTLNK
jgi:hypothetical protein